MTRPPDGWSASLRCDSRTGAAHLRRGTPCQDASGFWTVVDAAGDPVRLLVVSDGHGGSRYTRSDVGSRLACSVALEVIGKTLASSRTGQPGQERHWRRWLSESLPQQLVAAWLQAVREHWQANPAATGVAFSPVPYGATLGVLVLTPRWWGHTGLGDWDLVRITGTGEGHLVSEEPAVEAAGEATCSLCMQEAARQFAPRSGLHRLRAADPPFSLLLGTDGIRKSCGSDADFLTLARYLVDLPDPSGQDTPDELSAALDHISSQGSGDDVSVAIGRWGPLSASELRHNRARASQPRVVQPPGPVPASPSQPELPAAASLAERPRPLAVAGRPGVATAQAASRATAATSLQLWLGAALAGMGVLTLLAWWQGWGPFAARQEGLLPLTAAQRQQLQGQIALLCAADGRADRQVRGSVAAEPRLLRDDDASPPAAGQPGRLDPGRTDALEAGPGGTPAAAARATDRSEALALRIRGTLNNRSSSFRLLLSGDQSQRQALLRAGATDPLGALIAWSRQEPSLAPGLASLAPAASAAAERQPEPELRLCPELSQELQRQWRQRLRLSAVPSGASPAAPAGDPAAAGSGERRQPAAAGPGLAPESSGQQDAPAAIPARPER